MASIVGLGTKCPFGNIVKPDCDKYVKNCSVCKNNPGRLGR